jgi:maltose O-acetyltransferase
MIVGKRVFIDGRCVIDSEFYWLISIGDDVYLTSGTVILAHDSSTVMFLGYTRIGKVVIGNRVFIGANSVILPGVTIGDDVVIGAGSIVSMNIPSGSVAKGVPARVTGTINEFLARKREDMQTSPRFENEYTIYGNVNLARKSEMNEKLKGRYGYAP